MDRIKQHKSGAEKRKETLKRKLEQAGGHPRQRKITDSLLVVPSSTVVSSGLTGQQGQSQDQHPAAAEIETAVSEVCEDPELTISSVESSCETSAKKSKSLSSEPVTEVPEAADRTSPVLATAADLSEADGRTIMSSEEPSVLVTPPSSSVISDAFDISTVDFTVAISDTLKRKILLLGRFQPTKSWKGPLKLCGQKQRRVPAILLDQNVYSYMSYGLKSDSVFCVACSIFAKCSTTAPFIREGHSDWSNIVRHAERHVKSTVHVECVEAAVAFKQVCEGETLSIKQQLSMAYHNKVSKNREALISILKTICLCGKQNIALRGKTDVRSNFIALLQYKSEHDVVLREHLAHAPKNRRYISHRIQNELIDIIGCQIQETILTPCRKAKYLSVIIDETTDISVKEQVALVVLYVSSDGQRHEELISFEETADTTGETLYTLICKKLQDYGLDKIKVVGLGFDGASNMSGKVKGVQARFSVDVPTAQYVHCRAHCLNLAITYSCKEPNVRNIYAVVGDTIKFIGASAKRLHVYVSLDENADRLKKFCATRWGRHEETLGVFLDNIENVIDTLQYIMLHDTDKETSSKAQAFLGAIYNFSFLISLIVVHHYLKFTKPLSLSLQGTTNNLVEATNECAELVQMLRSQRSDGSTFKKLYENAVQLASEMDVDVKQPRTIGRQRHRANAPATTTFEYFEVNLHNTFLDHLITQLNDRLCGSISRVRAEMLLPQNLAKISHADCQHIKTAYNAFISDSDFDVELERWKWKHRDGNELMLKDCVNATRNLYPNLHNIFLVLLTMPVSSASAERSFSSLKRLKTYLRSTMGADRLTSLALMHIHKDTPVDFDRALQAFDGSGHRRIALAFESNFD